MRKKNYTKKTILFILLALVAVVLIAQYMKYTMRQNTTQKYNDIGISTLEKDVSNYSFKEYRKEYNQKYQELQTRINELNKIVTELQKDIKYSNVDYKSNILDSFDIKKIDYTNIDQFEEDILNEQKVINDYISKNIEKNINSQKNSIVESNFSQTNSLVDENITISTFNVLNKYNDEYAGDWDKVRLKENCSTIEKSKSDIIVINEAVKDTIEQLADCSGYGYIHNETTGILYNVSEFKLVDSGVYMYNIQQGNYEERKSVYAIFEYGNKKIALSGVHFDTDKSFAQKQTNETILLDEYLNIKYETDYSFIAGDFNYELQNENCNSGNITYKPKNTSIDRICSEQKAVTNNVIDAKGSDHNLVQSKFELK